MKSDLQKNWKLLNDMFDRNRRSVYLEFVIDGVGTEEGASTSKSFCDYFIAYPESIHDGIHAINHNLSSIIPMNQKSMALINCSVLQVVNVISYIKKNGSIDYIYQ